MLLWGGPVCAGLRPVVGRWRWRRWDSRHDDTTNEHDDDVTLAALSTHIRTCTDTCKDIHTFHSNNCTLKHNQAQPQAAAEQQLAATATTDKPNNANNNGACVSACYTMLCYNAVMHLSAGPSTHACNGTTPSLQLSVVTVAWRQPERRRRACRSELLLELPQLVRCRLQPRQAASQVSMRSAAAWRPPRDGVLHGR